jgi:hypothetical protein
MPSAGWTDTLSTCAAAQGFIEMQRGLPIVIGDEAPFGACLGAPERDMPMVQCVQTAEGIAITPLIMGAFDGPHEPQIAASHG